MAHEDDVSLKPGPNADAEDEVQKHISSEVLKLLDCPPISAIPINQ